MIEINNLTTSRLNEKSIKKIVETVLKEELKTAKYDPTGSRLGRQRNIGLSIAFIGSGRMRKLNKKYRAKNRTTDVLAFSEKGLPFEKYSKELQKIQGLGEVVICLREIKKSAQGLAVPFEKELTRVLIHGILHLLEYTHEKSEKEAGKMREKEEYYLGKIQMPKSK